MRGVAQVKMFRINGSYNLFRLSHNLLVCHACPVCRSLKTAVTMNCSVLVVTFNREQAEQSSKSWAAFVRGAR